MTFWPFVHFDIPEFYGLAVLLRETISHTQRRLMSMNESLTKNWQPLCLYQDQVLKCMLNCLWYSGQHGGRLGEWKKRSETLPPKTGAATTSSEPVPQMWAIADVPVVAQAFSGLSF